MLPWEGEIPQREGILWCPHRVEERRQHMCHLSPRQQQRPHPR